MSEWSDMTNTCTWPGGSTGFSGHFVIPVLSMSSSVTQLIMLWFLSTHQPGLNWQRNPGSNVVVSDYSHDITEILLKVGLNTRTHNHSSHYSLLIMRGSTFRKILDSLQKKAIWRRLSLSSIKSQLLNVPEPSKELLSKYWGPKCFCITFSAQTRIDLIDDKESRLQLSKYLETIRIYLPVESRLMSAEKSEHNQLCCYLKYSFIHNYLWCCVVNCLMIQYTKCMQGYRTLYCL
jgi:hypothetical protein